MFIKLRKFLIVDFVHTESTEGYGCPQADEVGEQQLSKIGQQLKEKKYISTDDTEGHGRLLRIIHTLYIFSGVHQATQVPDYSHIINFQWCSSSYASV